ncbi:GIY-YIG nuclease family protein [Balneola sp. MJW-20]|uniref:GIY-YIG nuclease family protein n=1 Tax=Gracilimonas aurantiaca TaxID=3234185 RepID=UPI003466E4BB
MSNVFYAYILKSMSHGTYYYGSTASLSDRVKEHNNGKVRYTKGRRPWRVHYVEKFSTRSEACKREQYFKTIEGYSFLKQKGII